MQAELSRPGVIGRLLVPLSTPCSNSKRLPSLPKIDVALRSVAGHELEVQLEPLSRCIDLKRKVAKLWKVPASFQQILIGESQLVPRDHQYLNAKIQDQAAAGPELACTLLVTMRVSWECVLRHLEGRFGPKRRTIAARSLSELVRRDGQGSLNAVVSLLAHPDRYVRDAAVNAVAAVPIQAYKGDLPGIFGGICSPNPEEYVDGVVKTTLASSSGSNPTPTVTANCLAIKLAARRRAEELTIIRG